MSDKPVKEPNEDLQSRAERLREKAQRTRKALLMKAKVENGKAKTYSTLSKMEKIKAKDTATDTQTKTASVTKEDLTQLLRKLA